MTFITALSGLNAAQTDISTTSNNIANVGTVGFHSSRAEFADFYPDSPYSNPQTTVGSGTQVTRVARSFQQGTVGATGNQLDLAIQGAGMFQMQTELNGGETAYSRAGAFGLNENGYIVNAEGYYLNAFPASDTGDVLSMVVTQPVKVEMFDGTPKATENIETAVNFPSGETISGTQAVVPADAFDSANPETFAYSNSINIFDADGQPQSANMYYILRDLPDVDDETTTFEVRLTIDGRDGTETFAGDATITFDGDGYLVDGAGQISFDVAGRSIAVDLQDSRIEDAEFAVMSYSQDGETREALSGLQVDDAGLIWAAYGGRESKAIGRVALANFNNLGGLENLGSATYGATRSSGAAQLGVPAVNGFGSIRSGALEYANVDLTKELVNLITAQRNFQASAKALETNQSLSQTIMNMRT